jgi:hypothetical protein
LEEPGDTQQDRSPQGVPLNTIEDVVRSVVPRLKHRINDQEHYGTTEQQIHSTIVVEPWDHYTEREEDLPDHYDRLEVVYFCLKAVVQKAKCPFIFLFLQFAPKLPQQAT